MSNAINPTGDSMPSGPAAAGSTATANATANAPTSLAPAVDAFVRLQLDGLAPFDFVSLGAPEPPFPALHIGRTEGGSFEVRVPPQGDGAPLAVTQRSKLVELGFRSADAANPAVPWVKDVADVDAALSHALSVLTGVLGGSLHTALNLLHGSTKAIHEAETRLAALRAQLEPLLTAMTGHAPKQDQDGDYLLEVGQVRVIVVPRAIPGAMSVVRIIAVTNTEINLNPDVGLFLARLNFGLMLGRFALDVEHRAIWFDETLLGDVVAEDQLRFTVDVVARTAMEWTGRLQQMFGGAVYAGSREPAASPAAAGPKPGAGAGGYL